MALIEMTNVSFRYPNEAVNALDQFSITIHKGEFIVVAGPSGCGKTTFLKLLKRELTPVGDMAGTIQYKGQQIEEWNEADRSNEIGYVFQNPENQIVMEDVLSELVFGLENQGTEAVEMRQRIAEMVHFFGLEHLLHKETITLSGGQKQLINLASILLLKPKLLLLDEPTSQLDPVQAKEFLQFLRRLNEEFGMTIILVEHRLEDVFSLADRVTLLSEGSLAYEGKTKAVIEQVWTNQDSRFLSYLPSISRLFYHFHLEGSSKGFPITVKEAQNWLSHLAIDEAKQAGNIELTKEEKGCTLLQVKSIHYKYKKDSPLILKNLSLGVWESDFLAVVGGNGSGKTTLLKCCANIMQPLKGKVKWKNKSLPSYKKKEWINAVGYLPQNPLLCFMAETLEEELLTIASRFNLDYAHERIETLTRDLGIQSILKKHIHDCSGGEQQKAALATVLLTEPKLLLIDEPTKGMDPISKRVFAKLLKQLHQNGMTILMVTHDIEFVAEHAKRCAWLFDGEITSIGQAEDVLKGNYFYTTTINRVTREAAVPVLTLEEADSKWKTRVPF
ncbi:ABC transporter ATP-binding protein [Halalkalibacter sp. AB-rgal2]|uniref:ABC transporter ATP-binding protein n=1 Tax=Halalkalibacter sp. AB-rgal2 TaxID=3242695 RepID=UPI00359CC646